MIGAAGLAAKGLPAEDGRRRPVDPSLVGKLPKAARRSELRKVGPSRHHRVYP
jgi:hypothetical protein